MKENRIHVAAAKHYDILIKKNILSICGSYLKELKIGRKILIVTQEKVPKQYLKQVQISLRKNHFCVHKLILPAGERYKNLNSLLKILNFAIKNNFERNDSFLALGGGVISDLTGFAASIYYRGNNFICIPTTLLGMVDAAIGGKTSINTKEGKNLIGTFYQPKVILIDPNCLKTLPKKEFLTGMGEVIKYSLLEKSAKVRFSKSSFFNFLKSNKNKILKLHKKELLKIITYSAKVKANIVSRDEKEQSLRAILNLGHTFGHGIEQGYDYKKYTHGEAISIGICLAAKLAYWHDMLSKEKVEAIINLIETYGLPTKLTKQVNLNKIIQSMMHDKKIKEGKFRFVLPEKVIGKVKIITGIPVKKIKALFVN